MTTRRRRDRGTALGWLLAGLLVGWSAGWATPCSAATLAADSVPSEERVAVSPLDATPNVLGELHLRRALYHLARLDLVAAVTELERCPLDPEVFPHADRAAFALVWGYERIGDDSGIARIATETASWKPSPYTEWIAGAELRRALRVEAGRVQRDASEGIDPLELSPDSYLESCRQLSAILDAVWGEQPEGAESRTELEAWLAAHPDHPSAFDAGLHLASLAIQDSDFDRARAVLEAVERDAELRRARLAALRTPEGLDQIGADWERGAGWSPIQVLEIPDVTPSGELDAWLPDLVVDSGRGAVDLPARPLRAAPGPAPFSRLVPLAPIDSLAYVASLESAAQEAFTERERAKWRLAQARWELDRRRAYLERGARAAAEETAEIRGLRDEIEALRADLDAILARIDAVSEEEIARLLERTDRIETRARETLLRIGGVRRFYEEGPDRDRRAATPGEYPSAGALLDRSEELAETLAATAARFREVMPERIRRSRDELWKPGLRADLELLARRTDVLLQRAESHEAAVAAKLAALDAGEFLAARHEDVRACEEQVDLRVTQWSQTRRRIADGAIEEELERMAAKQEGSDYAHALVAYELAVRGRGDANGARDRWLAFLSVYPSAAARGDALFRLADLELTLAKETFQESMAAYLALEDDARTRSVVPILESGEALRYYEEILASHPDFAHLDAVLYHVGVLRADEGDESGIAALDRLVRAYPSSPFRQEAELRMADFRFDSGGLDDAVPLYESAALGDDAGLSVIALYKLGWSHYRKDRFPEAAGAFARVLDLYAGGATAATSTDLSAESLDYLVHALSRGGGGTLAREFFDRIGPRPYESDVFLSVSMLLRRYALFPEAAESDRIWLDRFPEDGRALEVAKSLIETYDMGERSEQARAARLEMAERFLPGSRWAEANDADSSRTAARAFSRQAIHQVAVFHHQRAREMEAGAGSHDGQPATEEWERALALYDRILELWPEDQDVARIHYQIGEAAARSGKRERAHESFQIAAAARHEPFAQDAAWQSLAVLDAWYRDEAGDDLGRALLREGDLFIESDPFDPRGPDLAWRLAGVAFERGWDEDAAARYRLFAERFPRDERVPQALTLRGDVYYRAGDFDTAALAYQDAERAARASGADSLANALAGLVPHSTYLHAESLSGQAAAREFEQLALRWPQFEQAENALYRAGSIHAEEERTHDAIRCFEELLHRSPDGAYARDAHLQIAAVLEGDSRHADAARAYERFSLAFPEDPESGPALLHSADLWRDSGNEPAAEAIERSYVERFPEDRATAVAIFHRGATRLLDRLGGGEAFGPSAPSGGLDAALSPESDLGRYLGLVAADSTAADKAILARVDFLRAEELRARFEAVPLRQPLATALEEKKKALEAAVGAYRAALRRGASPWSQAATFRIGECLIAFGDQLGESERPADLRGDDLVAYDEVLEEQSWQFYDQGEEMWAQLLRGIAPNLKDEGRWIERTRSALWPRVAQRFVHYPEADHPVVAAVRPDGEDSK